VALGHRLVLVQPRVRRAEPPHPPLVAEALASQQRLLEARGPRPAVRHRRPPRAAQGSPPALQECAAFLHWFLREIPIEPVWLCPLRLREGSSALAAPGDDRPWPLYPLRAGQTYVNVGFWSTVPADPDAPEGAANRLIEAEVAKLHGHKSLYSDSYYDEAEFARLYGGDAYLALKARYDPQSRLLGLYSKAVQRK
jgi:FAD/FMN-containing dehydrogenase